MKSILLILITTAVTSQQAQSYKYLGDFSSKSTILYLYTFVDNVSIEIFGMINNSFPELYSAPDYNLITIDNITFNTLHSVVST